MLHTHRIHRDNTHKSIYTDNTNRSIYTDNTHRAAPGLSFAQLASEAVLADRPAEFAAIVKHGPRVREGHSVQSQGARGGRRGGVQQGQGPVILLIVLERDVQSS